MATYRQADEDVLDIIGVLMATPHHQDLRDAGVRVGARFAFAAVDEKTGEPKGHALKHHGWPAAAVVKIVSQKDRVSGMPDAMIDIDGMAWEQDWSNERKRAVLDHELTHLLVQRDDEGNIKLDDCCRPKLKMRPHDAEIGVFYDVVERFGEAAIEAEAYRGMHKKFTQLAFPWG